MKRPSDRKSVYLRVRITKGERARLRAMALPGESLSDVCRRILFAPPLVPGTEGRQDRPSPPKSGGTE